MKYTYKIITALLSLAVIPAVIFAPFFKIIATSDLMSMFSSSSSIVLDKTYSLYGLYTEFIKGKLNAEGAKPIDFKALWAAIPQEIKDRLATPLLIFVIMFALVIIISIVLFVIVLVTKKRKFALITSILGLISVVGMNSAFTKFTTPLTNGTIPLTSLLTKDIVALFSDNPLLTLGSGLLSAFNSLSSNIVQLKLFNLSTAYIMILMAFILSTVWIIANQLVDSK